MRSVFSSKPIASAKRRTDRGLTTAHGTPCRPQQAEGAASHIRRSPPSQRARRACSRQNAASCRSRPRSLEPQRLVRRGPTRASKFSDETSTPQMIFVTVTCLVHAIDNRATVRSCVTRGSGPKAHPRLWPEGDGRRPPREGSGGHRTPSPHRSHHNAMPNSRYKGGWETARWQVGRKQSRANELPSPVRRRKNIAFHTNRVSTSI